MPEFLCLDLDGVFVDWVRDCFCPAGERVLRRALPHLSEETFTDAEHDAIWESEELLDALLEAPVIERSLPVYGYNRHLESHPLVFPVHWNRPIAPAA